MADCQLDVVFAVCAAAEGCEDLSAGRLYRVLPDPVASAESLLRVIDDSGEDYLYPATRFVVVEVPRADVARLLILTSARVA